MKILNMSHPLSGEAIEQIASLTGCPKEDIQEIMIPVQLDMDADIKVQLDAICHQVWLKGHHAWLEHERVLYIPPALSFAAAAVAASLGNGAFYPPMVVMKGVGTPRRFVVAAIV